MTHVFLYLQGQDAQKPLEMTNARERVSSRWVFDALIRHVSMSLDGEYGSLRTPKVKVGDGVGILARDPQRA